MTPDELTREEQQQAAFVREALSALPEFRPYAVFDSPLDCIRVGWRDCSVTEIRVNALLTVLEANHPIVEEASEIAGFTIKGVAHLCETYKISQTAPWRLADFLDAVLNDSEPRERVIVKHVVEPMVQQRNLDEVEKIAA